jgi:hypothetical protein
MSSGFEDPMVQLLEGLGDPKHLDDYIIHLASLSDNIKNDMRAALQWDEAVIARKLCDAVAHQLDSNGRYRERPIEDTAPDGEKFSKSYVESQCLLTEWLVVYQALRAYCRIRIREYQAKKAMALQHETTASA